MDVCVYVCVCVPAYVVCPGKKAIKHM